MQPPQPVSTSSAGLARFQALRVCVCSMRRLVLVLAVAGVRAADQHTDMQKWAGLLAQSFLAHSPDTASAHSQLQQFKELVNSKVPADHLPLVTTCWSTRQEALIDIFLLVHGEAGKQRAHIHFKFEPSLVFMCPAGSVWPLPVLIMGSAAPAQCGACTLCFWTGTSRPQALPR